MRQPIPLGPGGTSDSYGNLTLTYPNVPTGQTWIGTIAIPGAPASALVVAQVGNLNYGSWTGSNTFGPITVGQSDNLELTITNLLPSTPYQPAWNGVVYTNEDGPLVWPSANSSSVGVYFPFVPVGTYAAKATGVGTQSFDVTIQGSWRSLYLAGLVFNGATPATPKVVGIQSGFQYSVYTDGSTTGANAFYWHVPLLPVGVDQTVRVTITNNTVATNLYYGGDFAPAEQAVYVTNIPTVTVQGGSTIAVETYPVGGVTATSVTTTGTAAVQILPAPAAGTCYRLHMAAIYTASGSLDVEFYDNVVICQLHAGTSNQQTLDGLLVTAAINVKNSAVTSTQCVIRYDTIVTPTIS